MIRLSFFAYIMIIFVSCFGITLTEGKQTDLESKIVRAEKQNLSKELIEIINSKDMRREKIRRTQAILVQLGYDPGPVDGFMGVKTQKALIEWKKIKKEIASIEQIETKVTIKNNANIYKNRYFGIDINGLKITQIDNTGELFSLNYKSMSLLPSDDLSQYWIESLGQAVEPVDSGWILYSSGSTVSASTKSISVEVNGVTKVFNLDSKTTLCDGPHRIERSLLQKGEIVTVSTSPGSRTKALKIRKGPILVKGGLEMSDRGEASIPVSDKLINTCQLKW